MSHDQSMRSPVAACQVLRVHTQRIIADHEHSIQVNLQMRGIALPAPQLQQARKLMAKWQFNSPAAVSSTLWKCSGWIFLRLSDDFTPATIDSRDVHIMSIACLVLGSHI